MLQQIQIITLSLAIFCNLIMSIITARGWKNLVYRYFSIMTFFNVLWASGLLIFNISNNVEIVQFFASFIYLAALMVVLNLFYFSWYFPFKIFNLNKFWHNFLTLSLSFFSLYFIFFYKHFVPSVNIVGNNDCVFNFVPYTIFSTVLLMLMLGSVIILFIKYFRVDVLFKKSILLIIVAVLFGVITGSYFNLIAMYLDNFNNYHFGPLFTLVINFTAFYLIFIKKNN
jgi:hypothetical protein